MIQLCHVQDMLQMLIDTTFNENEDGDCDRLTDHQIIGYAIDFLMSGYETTASVLSYVSHKLALSTTIQTQVQNEIDAYFKKKSVSIYLLDIAQCSGAAYRGDTLC